MACARPRRAQTCQKFWRLLPGPFQSFFSKYPPGYSGALAQKSAEPCGLPHIRSQGVLPTAEAGVSKPANEFDQSIDSWFHRHHSDRWQTGGSCRTLLRRPNQFVRDPCFSFINSTCVHFLTDIVRKLLSLLKPI